MAGRGGGRGHSWVAWAVRGQSCFMENFVLGQVGSPETADLKRSRGSNQMSASL